MFLTHGDSALEKHIQGFAHSVVSFEKKRLCTVFEKDS